MKRRAETMLLALALAAGAFWLQAMAFPVSTFACSCIPADNLREVAADGKSIVLATVEARIGVNFHTVSVTHTFAGDAEPGELRVHGLGPYSDACQQGAVVGETWLFSLAGYGRKWTTTSCDLNGRIGTDEGDSLLAEAVKRFGPILPDTSTHDAQITSPPGSYGAVLAIGAGVVVFVLLTLRWRPSRT